MATELMDYNGGGASAPVYSPVSNESTSTTGSTTAPAPGYGATIDPMTIDSYTSAPTANQLNMSTTMAAAPAATSTTTTSSADPAIQALIDAMNAQNTAAKAAADQAKADAAKQLSAVLSGYGLSADIGAGITALIQNGIDAVTITTMLDSFDPATAINGLGLTGTQLSAAQGLVKAWQTRFSGNQARIAAGLNPLDPATYIANEQSYKQVMTMAGIPTSSPLMQTSYLGNLIATDVSPAEVNMRVQAATTAVQNEDPQVLAQLQSQYGLSMSTIISHLLDPKTSAPVVQQEVSAAQIGAEASRVGANIAFGGPNALAGQTGLTAMQLAGQGVTQSQAQAGFQAIANQQPSMQAIASRYGGSLAPNQIGAGLEAATFGTTVNGVTQAQAQAQLERLKTQEVGAFSGSAGAATGSLGLKDISGLS